MANVPAQIKVASRWAVGVKASHNIVSVLCRKAAEAQTLCASLNQAGGGDQYTTVYCEYHWNGKWYELKNTEPAGYRLPIQFNNVEKLP